MSLKCEPSSEPLSPQLNAQLEAEHHPGPPLEPAGRLLAHCKGRNPEFFYHYYYSQA